MGSHRVGHDWSDLAAAAAELLCSDGKGSACNTGDAGSIVGKILWRREQQLTLVLLPGKFHEQRSLGGYSPWGRSVSETSIFTFTFSGTVLGIKDLIHGGKDIEWEWGRGGQWLRKNIYRILEHWFLTGGDFSPLFYQETFLAMSEDVFGCHNFGGRALLVCKWVEALGATELPPRRRTASSLLNKNYMILNVSSVAVEKSWIRVMITVTE